MWLLLPPPREAGICLMVCEQITNIFVIDEIIRKCWQWTNGTREILLKLQIWAGWFHRSKINVSLYCCYCCGYLQHGFSSSPRSRRWRDGGRWSRCRCRRPACVRRRGISQLTHTLLRISPKRCIEGEKVHSGTLWLTSQQPSPPWSKIIVTVEPVKSLYPQSGSGGGGGIWSFISVSEQSFEEVFIFLLSCY